MRAAFQIPVSAETLQTIGELCAIQGQIEWCFQNTVRNLLEIEQPTGLAIMGSTSIGANAEIWIRVVREKIADKQAVQFAELAYKEISILAQGRNDFVHAVYGSPKGEPGEWFLRPDLERLSPAVGAVAVRVRNRSVKETSTLNEVRDKAALTSLLVAHVNWIAFEGDGPSPWLDRLAPLLPPEHPKAEPRKAKGKPPPPESSRE